MPSSQRRLTATFKSPNFGLRATVPLAHGGGIPWLGLGVWQISGDAATERVVRSAIDLGYRSIDTATIYGNERGVGRAVRASGVPREELFVTTKVWNDDIRTGRVAEAFEASLRALGLDYVDLYLVHWPIRGKVVATWKAVEKLLLTGRVKAIGVSNHMVPHLEELLAEAEVVPAVNQIEFHPYLQSRPLLEYCRGKGIQLEAWSPLMVGGAVLQDPTLTAIAARHRKTIAQVILRWDVQGGIVTIPKTQHQERMAENAAIFDFVLSEEEMAAIDALDRDQRTGADPMNVPF
ncbi:aldo/keto reductase [Opitutus sp. ER46]|uniref:aldo/keto reductase n=1 Tax=Opitutus sp. ER46 TaxID=2161864 RepID=UPI000D30DE26|nr:aldo/keto reductase [Opitutus sp. ER46]PTX94428.1 aldo/keto reductase [Opitutus sp. ER46]